MTAQDIIPEGFDNVASVLRNMRRRAKSILHVIGESFAPEWIQDHYHLSGFLGTFDTPVELERHRRTLAAAAVSDKKPWDDVLEVGCSEGVFTSQLATRCSSLRAWDISAVACKRAAKRCCGCPNVSIEKRDLVCDRIQGTYDLIFVMDILEYVRGIQRLEAVVSKLAAAMRAGGLLVVSDCDLDEGRQHSWTARKFVMTRNQRLAFFHAHSQLRLIHEEIYPESGCHIPDYLEHVISVFEKR